MPRGGYHAPMSTAFPGIEDTQFPHQALLPTVIVLASGRGERFRAAGGAEHKLQADLWGRTVLQRTLDAVQASGLPWYLEDQGLPGMGDSIAAAVQATPGAQGWLILPADLPLVLPATLHFLASTQAQARVLVPTVHGQRGHPVRFARELGAALAACVGPQGAVALTRGPEAVQVSVEDEGCILDIDTPTQLEAARALWRQRHRAP